MKLKLLFFALFTAVYSMAQIPNLTFTQSFDYPENDPQDGSVGSILDPTNMSLYQGNYNIPYIAVTSGNAVSIASGEAVVFRIFMPPHVQKVSISINGPDGLATQFLRVAVIGEADTSNPTPTSYSTGDLLDSEWQWLSSTGNYVYNRNSSFINSESEIYLVLYNGQNLDTNYDGIVEGDYPNTLTLGSFMMSWSIPELNQQDYIDWATGSNSTADITEIQTERIMVYPNPTSEFIQIQTSQKDLTSIEIIDASGNIVTIIENDFKQMIPVQSFPKGLYWINVVSEEQTMKAKFIVK